MDTDQNIFGLRHHSNVYLYPTAAELAAFVDDPALGSRRSDLAAYHTLVDAVRESRRSSSPGGPGQDTGWKIFLNVLEHTRFATPALAAELAHYLYFLQALMATDIRKPTTFIRAAEEEMKKLDIRNRAQADRLKRLRQLSEQRRQDLEKMRKRREALCEEMLSIGKYVRDNLRRIRNVCRISIIVLSDRKLAGQIEDRLSEDVKAHFRHSLTVHADRPALTPAYLEALKRDVEVLGREITALRRQAASALDRLYRSLQQHAGSLAREIDAVLFRLGERHCEGDATDQMLFGQLEKHLLSLVSGWRPEPSLPEHHTATPYEDVFAEKKREALTSLFDLVHGERRAIANRRTGRIRRRKALPMPGSLERRSGRERRSGNDRRVEAVLA